MSDSPPPLVSMRHLSKTFAGTRALDDVEFELRAGEVHALLGQNGSGKSTLIKLLAGFHAPDPGSVIELGGEVVEIPDTQASRALGLRFVHQDLGLVQELSTVENLALGRGYRTGFGGRIRWRDERRDATRRMLAIGYDLDVRRPVRELGAAERTGVAIARALDHAEDARVLVVDEPTAALPRHEVAALFKAIAHVRALGLGVVYVSHRLDEIFEIADRATVLRDGRNVATCDVATLDHERLVTLMIGDETLVARPERGGAAGPTRLDARGLCGAVVDNVDLIAHAGEVLGVAGLTGSGREELLRIIFGGRPRDGEVVVDGASVAAGRPDLAISAGLALVPADRHALGSIMSMRVSENCTLTDLRRLSAAGGRLSRARERREVDDWIRALDVRPPAADVVFATLSGGNQQKVVLAKWLRLRPKVLLLDEPTQGVDIHAKAVIHALAREAADEGAAVIVASSDDTEICDICDRAVVLWDGRVVGELSGPELTPEAVHRMQFANGAATTSWRRAAAEIHPRPPDERRGIA